MPTILVADDNSNIQKMVALAFKDEGIDVIAVGNGEAAVRKAAEIVPDLVLADIFMPVRNGYEVCECIKQDPKLSHIPVVLLVGAFDPFNEREAQRVSADGVLKKPFVPPDPLVGIVKSLLSKSTVAQLVPIAVSVPEPALAAVERPAPYAPIEQRPLTATPQEHETEIEEEVPVTDFPIQSAQIQSIPEGGADAFGGMLDTTPLGTIFRPFPKPKTEQNHSQTQPADSSGIFAAGPVIASTREHGSTGAEEKTSPEDSAQFPPLREQISRDWGTHSSSLGNTDEGEMVEPEKKAGVEDWRASFPVSASREAEILHPSEPALSLWRDFKFGSGRVAERFAEDEAETTANGETEQGLPRIDEPKSEPEKELTTPAEINSLGVTAASEPIEAASSLEASSPAIELAHPSAQTAEPEADPAPAPPALVETSRNIDFPAVSKALESEQVSVHTLEAKTDERSSAVPDSVPAELQSATEGIMQAEFFPVPASGAADPRVVEEIVARVVERMQPQILEIVTREVLRPVVEALVRRQLEQK